MFALDKMFGTLDIKYLHRQKTIYYLELVEFEVLIQNIFNQTKIMFLNCCDCKSLKLLVIIYQNIGKRDLA